MIFTNIAEKSRFIKNISNCYEKTFFFNHCVIWLWWNCNSKQVLY